MTLYIIALIIGFIALIIGAIRSQNEDSRITIYFVFFGTLMITMSMVSMVIYDKPTALDVYRGNTTLEITYRDSIPVDSAVVFKE